MEWFQELTPAQKCLWMYLCSACDHAGVWNENWRMASFCVGVTLTHDDLTVFGERVEILRTGKGWLTGFIRFQYGGEVLNPENTAHRGVIRALEAAQPGLSGRFLSPSSPEGSGKPLISPSEAPLKPLQSPFKGAQDKDKEKDQEKAETGSAFVLLPDPAPVDPRAERQAALRALAPRVGAIMRRRPDTAWGKKEKDALAALYPLPLEDLALVETYYSALIPSARDIRRRDLVTLLNNWSGEVDRARAFCALAAQPRRRCI